MPSRQLGPTGLGNLGHAAQAAAADALGSSSQARGSTGATEQPALSPTERGPARNSTPSLGPEATVPGHSMLGAFDLVESAGCQTFRPTHYSLTVELELPPEKGPPLAPGALHVIARLTVLNESPRPMESLPLLLYRLHDVDMIAVDGQTAPFVSRLTALSGEERRQVNAVEVKLEPPLAPGKQATVECHYGGPMAGAREVWPYLWDQVGRDYTLLRPDALWYPVPCSPTAVAFHGSFRHAFTGDLRALIPRGYTAVAAGEECGKRTSFRWASPRSRIDLAVAPFACLTAGGVAVYYLPGFEAWGRDVVGWVTRAIEGLSSRLGSRDTRGLKLAQIPDGWGSQASPGLILQEVSGGEGWWAAAMVIHEVAHSWTPFPADWPNRFSDEAVAQYLQAVVVGDLFGPEVSAENLTFYRRALEDAQGASNVGLLGAADHPELLEVLTRCKGPLALDDLRVRLGERAFWPLLGEYCRAETATAEGFVDLLLLHRPGAETEAYLETWFR